MKFLILPILLTGCVSTNVEFAQVKNSNPDYTIVQFADGNDSIYRGNLGSPGDLVKVERGSQR